MVLWCDKPPTAVLFIPLLIKKVTMSRASDNNSTRQADQCATSSFSTLLKIRLRSNKLWASPILQMQYGVESAFAVMALMISDLFMVTRTR